ncbi:MAG: hypothetical protein KDB23_23545, partial [Planctomycetales bacterium]|nr:hypothetical protein [Planctomycetales bacterium]
SVSPATHGRFLFSSRQGRDRGVNCCAVSLRARRSAMPVMAIDGDRTKAVLRRLECKSHDTRLSPNCERRRVQG